MSAPLSLSDLDLPRRNGELAFDAPWQSTVFALAAAVIEHAFGGEREPFRRQLIAAIAAEPGRPYWESWTAALEALMQTLPGQQASDDDRDGANVPGWLARHGQHGVVLAAPGRLVRPRSFWAELPCPLKAATVSAIAPGPGSPGDAGHDPR